MNAASGLVARAPTWSGPAAPTDHRYLVGYATLTLPILHHAGGMLATEGGEK
jgi:hypothetical protein